MSHSKAPSADMRIVVSKDGPYLVSGGVPLCIQEIVPNKEGMSWEWKAGPALKTGENYSLCRCGQTKTAPFCDGSHETNGFDGTETASRAKYEKQAQQFDGPAMVLSDAENLCAFARFCDPGGKIWSLIEKTDNAEARALVIREAMHCPSGRLALQDKATGKEIEEPLEPSIGIVEDPAMGCSGPLWVRGGIPIESAGGKKHETRNRVTLCRCGESTNKPFCNGAHAGIKYKDGIGK